MPHNTTFSIIAPNIKSGGGRELLEYLIEHLESHYSDLFVVAYLDASLNHIQESSHRKVVLLDATIKKIKLFTQKVDNSLYFGNLPPLRKSTHSAVYFHNRYLLMDPSKLVTLQPGFFIKYSLQQLYIHAFIRNTDVVACQSRLIKDQLYDKYRVKHIEILPFFRLCKKSIDKIEKRYDLCYVSLAHQHKNHILLLDALEILSNKKLSLSIAVTVESERADLLDRMERINYRGIVRIDNLGVISKEEVCALYSQTRCLVYPSNEESFGLCLVEAVHMGLDVIASDLDYVYQVVEPSAVFDSNSSKSCADAIQKYLLNIETKQSHVLINNNIDKLISRFTYKGAPSYS